MRDVLYAVIDRITQPQYLTLAIAAVVCTGAVIAFFRLTESPAVSRARRAKRARRRAQRQQRRDERKRYRRHL